MGVYIINKKKYDTNKMELISNKFRYEYEVNHPILVGLHALRTIPDCIKARMVIGLLFLTDMVVR